MYEINTTRAKGDVLFDGIAEFVRFIWPVGAEATESSLESAFSVAPIHSFIAPAIRARHFQETLYSLSFEKRTREQVCFLFSFLLLINRPARDS